MFWYFMALTFQLIFVKFLKVKPQRECAVLLFYMIDEISLLSHTHLVFCNKEWMMIWERKHEHIIMAKHKHIQNFKVGGGTASHPIHPPWISPCSSILKPTPEWTLIFIHVSCNMIFPSEVANLVAYCPIQF